MCVAVEEATPRAGRTAKDVARYVLGLLIGAVVLLLLFGRRGQFVDSWHQLGRIDGRWVIQTTTLTRLRIDVC